LSLCSRTITKNGITGLAGAPALKWLCLDYGMRKALPDLRTKLPSVELVLR
jgi:hypothetical protein